jgi:hypothetical protein
MPSCKLPKHYQICKPNATDTTNYKILYENGVPVFKGSCFSHEANCYASLTNDEVVLFYWPSNVSTDKCPLNRTSIPTDDQRTLSPPRIAVIPEITFRGQNLYWVGWSDIGGTSRSLKPTHISASVMKGPFTFTSPTIYLAHHPLTFAYVDIMMEEYIISSMSVRPAGIIELKPTDVYSMVPKHPINRNYTEYVSLVANGKFTEKVPMMTTVPLNFGDLQDPVPAKAFFDARWGDCWGEQSHCRTITDGNYRPQLVISSSVWGTKSVATYGKCLMPNLVDPPIALTPIGAGALEEGGPSLPSIRRGTNLAASVTYIPFLHCLTPS